MSEIDWKVRAGNLYEENKELRARIADLTAERDAAIAALRAATEWRPRSTAPD